MPPSAPPSIRHLLSSYHCAAMRWTMHWTTCEGATAPALTIPRRSLTALSLLFVSPGKAGRSLKSEKVL